MERLTPVIVGVAQVANKDEDRLVSPLCLIEDAVRAAAADSDSAILQRLDGVFLSPPWVNSNEVAAKAVGERLGVIGGAYRSGGFSGSTPQELLAVACEEVARGTLAAVVVGGGVADASVRSAEKKGIEALAPVSAHWTWRADDRTRAVRPRSVESIAGLNSAGAMFAMIESRLAFLAGRTPDQQREWLGTMMAQFTEVAALHPDLAWFPRTRQPAFISEVRANNRLVAEPYTKLMNSFPDVDMAGAVIVTSTKLASDLGVAQERWVFPWSAATCHEAYVPSERPQIQQPQALGAAVVRALEGAGVQLDGIDLFDLYSCFPSSVQMGAAALGLDVFDRRGLTVTGGLPYFGGPGAAYVALSIASMVKQCRAAPGSVGAIIAVGGLVSNFAAALYSTDPGLRPWAFDDCADVEKMLIEDRVSVAMEPRGKATVEAMTVLHDREGGPNAAPVFARFADGRRTGARLASPGLAVELSGRSLIGCDIDIRLEDGQPVYEPG